MRTIIAFMILACYSFAADLKPLMTVTDKVLFQSDFSTPGTLDKTKTNYSIKQGTRWAIEDGVLRGRPSTPEYQAGRKDHKGTEARLSLPVCPVEFAIRFSFRFIGGQYTGATPMIELGHHITRVQWTTNGIRLLADHDGLQVAADAKFILQTNQWYQAFAEVRGGEALFQFDGGPMLYGKHESIQADTHAFGIAGLKGGAVELDDITIWSIASNAPAAWEKTRAMLPAQTTVLIGAKK
ncbi:MAG: hypothetical protein AABZ39_07060 [Spirochaetota bacterium]